jgi:hypothetical protein
MPTRHRHRRRIWCETLPCAALSEPRTRALLRRFAIEPIVAAFPSTDVADLARAMEALAGEGLPAVIWPMLADGDGRWANAGNAEAFARYTLSLVEQLALRGLAPVEVAIDLEPSIEDLRPSPADASIHAHFLRLSTDQGSFARARDALRALGDALRERGVRISAAAPPTVLLDPEAGERRPFQEMLGTPVDGLLWDHVSVMLYTSIIEGWSVGVLRREDTRALLGAFAALAEARFGEKAGVSLGAVGVGAFGDEPVYRSSDELADDVAIVTAAGALDLTLFDLGGVLRREDPEAWLEAFTRTAPAERVPAPTLRVRVGLQGARLAGGALGTLRSLRRRRGSW